MSKAELAAMAEEATVGTYGDDEQAMGFRAMIVDNLKIPCVTGVLGVEVTVEYIGLGEDNSILAVCARGGIRQQVAVPLATIVGCQQRLGMAAQVAANLAGATRRSQRTGADGHWSAVA